jgi:hypothetical protein
MIGRLIISFKSSTPEEREAARNVLSVGSSLALLGYAWEKAEVGVFHKSPEVVAEGLFALAIENGRLDARDNVVGIAVLFRSAQKLGMDARTDFARAADLISNPWLEREMRNFPLRKPEQADLKRAFYIAESNAPGGFRCVQKPWPMHRIIWKEKLRGLLRRLGAKGRQSTPSGDHHAI